MKKEEPQKLIELIAAINRDLSREEDRLGSAIRA
jgi:hypothetical protein